MSSKRTPQTAAKRAREQAVKEKRELKAAKRQAVLQARKDPPAAGEEGAELTDLQELDGSSEPPELPDPARVEVETA